MSRNGSVPLTPASTGVLLDDRQHLARHLDDDLVGVAIGHQAGERAAPGHAVAAGVVDDDQVDAAGFLAFGGKPGAGAAADDRLAARDHGAELLQQCRHVRTGPSVTSPLSGASPGRSDAADGTPRRSRPRIRDR